MTLFRNTYRVESSRLRGWDYRNFGFYFVTICTKNKTYWFGEIKNGIMGLSDIGCIVADEWQKTEKLRYYVILDRWVVMPNHIHGIIRIIREPTIDDAIRKTKNDCSRTITGVIPYTTVETHRRCVSTGVTIWDGNQPLHFHRKRDSIGSIIAQFKSKCTKRIRKIESDFAWQPQFHDRIIRNNQSLWNMRRYITNNPHKWIRDRNNTQFYDCPRRR